MGAPEKQAPLSQVVLVTGKGGVGKTTVALWLASAAAARDGSSVLVEFGDGESGRRLLARRKNTIVHEVIAPQEAIARCAASIFGSGLVAKAVLGNFALKRFLRATPAIRELAMLECVRLVAEEHPKKRVVVYMPATGHGVAWLRVPAQMRDFTAAGPLFSLCDRVCRELLIEKRTSIVVVTLPEPLVLSETRQLVDAMAKDVGMRPALVLVNRFPAALPAGALDDARALAGVPGIAGLVRALEARAAAGTEARDALHGAFAGAGLLPVLLPQAPSDPQMQEVAAWLTAEGCA